MIRKLILGTGDSMVVAVFTAVMSFTAGTSFMAMSSTASTSTGPASTRIRTMAVRTASTRRPATGPGTR